MALVIFIAISDSKISFVFPNSLGLEKEGAWKFQGIRDQEAWSWREIAKVSASKNNAISLTYWLGSNLLGWHLGPTYRPLKDSW